MMSERGDICAHVRMLGVQRFQLSRPIVIVLAARLAEGKGHEKTNRRFDPTALAALSRIFAREAALKVTEEGLRWIAGAGGAGEGEMPAFETSLQFPAVHRAQAGLVSDMDYIADVLYSRVAKPALAA